MYGYDNYEMLLQACEDIGLAKLMGMLVSDPEFDSDLLELWIMEDKHGGYTSSVSLDDGKTLHWSILSPEKVEKLNENMDTFVIVTKQNVGLPDEKRRVYKKTYAYNTKFMQRHHIPLEKYKVLSKHAIWFRTALLEYMEYRHLFTTDSITNRSNGKLLERLGMFIKDLEKLSDTPGYPNITTLHNSAVDNFMVLMMFDTLEEEEIVYEF